MRLLKIWSGFLLSVSMLLYGIGVFSGKFNSHIFGGFIYTGKSEGAILMSAISFICLLHSISLFIVIYAINNRDK